MKSKLFLSLMFLLLTACSIRNLPTDKPLDDGSYYYSNNYLGFSLVLPDSFEYYQTQRIVGDAYDDLEILVPTSDGGYFGKVPGYARPILIRIFTAEKWREMEKNNTAPEEYFVLHKGQKKVYTMSFWEEEPKDWQTKWNDQTEKKIMDSFKLK